MQSFFVSFVFRVVGFVAAGMHIPAVINITFCLIAAFLCSGGTSVDQVDNEAER